MANIILKANRLIQKLPLLAGGSLLLLLISACGFEPIYATNNSSARVLSNINIQSPSTIDEQTFYRQLDSLLKTGQQAGPSLYDLSYSLKNEEISIAIEQDRTVTRYRVVVYVTYRLISKEDQSIIAKGTLRREGGYDRVESDYATYVSKNDMTSRLVKELAYDLKNELWDSLSSKESL